MADAGITISQSGTSVTTASGAQVILNTKYPLAKMDRTNPISFQTFNITFNANPPQTLNETITTTIYQFAHGYNYVPSTWALGQVVNTTAEWSEEYLLEGGILAATSQLGNEADLQILTDIENVYVNVQQLYYDNSIPPPDITGLILNLRIYVFVEDLGL